MCGIVGFHNLDGSPVEQASGKYLASMCRSITHRGPDEDGSVLIGPVALGMTRLSIIDLKTGSPRVGHRDDLRFYALLDTLRIGVPPRLIASFYLDTGIAEVEPVTEALLDATVARTVDGAVQIAELRAGTRAPIHRPAHQCRWCPVLSTCDVGRRWLADEDIPVPQPDEA